MEVEVFHQGVGVSLLGLVVMGDGCCLAEEEEVLRSPVSIPLRSFLVGEGEVHACLVEH